MSKRKQYLKFEDLTKPLQKSALAYFATDLLKDILEHGVRFNDDLNSNDLQARIDEAIDKADKMRTPWFAHEYIMETCKDDINGMAQCTAEDAQYHLTPDGKTLSIVETVYHEVKHA